MTEVGYKETISHFCCLAVLKHFVFRDTRNMNSSSEVVWLKTMCQMIQYSLCAIRGFILTPRAVTHS